MILRGFKTVCFCFVFLIMGCIEDENSGDHTVELYDESAPPLVFIFAGQSNMVGYGNTDELDQSHITSSEAIRFYNAEMYGGEACLTEISELTHFGPEVSFINNLVANGVTRKIIIIKFAVGATSIYHWHPDYDSVKDYTRETYWTHSEYLYDILVTHIFDVLSKEEEKDYDFGGMFWMQGETDACPVNGNYLDLMIGFISYIRDDVGSNEMPFILAKIHPGDSSCSWGIDRQEEISYIREEQEDLHYYVKNTGFVDTKDLTCGQDGIHFDSYSQLLLGNMFFSKCFNTDTLVNPSLLN